MTIGYNSKLNLYFLALDNMSIMILLNIFKFYVK